MLKSKRKRDAHGAPSAAASPQRPYLSPRWIEAGVGAFLLLVACDHCIPTACCLHQRRPADSGKCQPTRPAISIHLQPAGGGGGGRQEEEGLVWVGLVGVVSAGATSSRPGNVQLGADQCAPTGQNTPPFCLQWCVVCVCQPNHDAQPVAGFDGLNDNGKHGAFTAVL